MNALAIEPVATDDDLTAMCVVARSLVWNDYEDACRRVGQTPKPRPETVLPR